METMTLFPPYDSPTPYADTCPTRQVLDLIADKWTVLIIGMLESEPKRFTELRRAIEGYLAKDAHPEPAPLGAGWHCHPHRLRRSPQEER